MCFSQSAHLAMIDTLMMAYTVETVSVEKVMACIRQYSPGDAEVETPYDTEDAVTTWINRVSPCMRKCVLTTPHCGDARGVEVSLEPNNTFQCSWIGIISSLRFSVCIRVSSQHPLSCDESRK